ncbi:MAG: hypothetical protein ACRDP4_15490, partial [Nocardioidaceae bacterium]
MTEAEEQLAGDDDDLPPGPPRQRGFFRRHLALTGLAGIVLLLAVGVLGFLWYLNHQLGSIPRVTAGVTRQAETASIDDSDQALNILVLATERSASGHSAAEDLADG